MYNEAKGLLEVEYSAILSLIGANQPLSYPVFLNNCIVLLVVEPSPFPLASLRDLSWASVPFIPKLEPDFNSLIPQQAFFFPCFHHKSIFLLTHLLICLSHIKWKDRVCTIFTCSISRFSVVIGLSFVNWSGLSYAKAALLAWSVNQSCWPRL